MTSRNYILAGAIFLGLPIAGIISIFYSALLVNGKGFNFDMPQSFFILGLGLFLWWFLIGNIASQSKISKLEKQIEAERKQ